MIIIFTFKEEKNENKFTIFSIFYLYHDDFHLAACGGNEEKNNATKDG